MNKIHSLVVGLALGALACDSSLPTGPQGAEAGAASSSLWPEPPPNYGASTSAGGNPWLDGLGAGAALPDGGSQESTGGRGAGGQTDAGGSGPTGNPGKKGTEGTGGEGATTQEPDPSLSPARLLITRYEESTGSAKRLEIRNQGRALAAEECSLMIYSNGNVRPYRTIALEALLANQRSRLCTTDVLDSNCTLSLGATSFNGNDAIVLACGPDVVDSFGRVGEDPGRGWSQGALRTWDTVLLRCGNTADPDPSDAFSLSLNWVSDAFELSSAEIDSLCLMEHGGPGGAGPF